MKYFTKELWASWQDPNHDNVRSHAEWQELLAAYHAQLEALRSRLDAATFAFFKDAPVHDGQLVAFRFAQHEIEWDGSHELRYPVSVEIQVREEGGRQ